MLPLTSNDEAVAPQSMAKSAAATQVDSSDARLHATPHLYEQIVDIPSFELVVLSNRHHDKDAAHLWLRQRLTSRRAPATTA